MPLLDSLQFFSLEAKNGHYRIGYLQLCNQTIITLYEIMQWLIFPKSVKMVQEIWSGDTCPFAFITSVLKCLRFLGALQ